MSPARPGGAWRVAPAALALLAALAACLPRQAPGPAAAGPAAPPVELQLLALSDFHGRLVPGADGSPPGAVALLAALEAAALPGASLVVSAGDLFGASAPESGLLREEPTVAAFGCLCRGPGCPVAALGNHELDRGLPALRRLLGGDPSPPAPVFQAPWPGAAFPLLCANLRDRATGRPVLPPSVVREVAGVRVGLVGAVTAELPRHLRAAALEGLEVEDEADAVNREVRRLRAEGAGVVVVLLHEGRDVPDRLGAIVARLDPGVDLVVTGHSHQRDERRLPTADPARRVLVTQAGPHGAAFHDVRLRVDPARGRVIDARTRLVEVGAPGPGGAAARCAEAQVARAEAAAAPVLGRLVGALAAPAPQVAPGGGAPAARLVAEAYRAALGADLGLVNLGGVRAPLRAGPVTARDLLLVQPFGNTLCSVALDGAALADLLDRQRRGAGGAAVEWAGLERRGGAATAGGRPIRPGERYTVATIDYLLSQDRVPGLAAEGARCTGPLDVEALEAWIAARPGPAAPPPPAP